MFSPSNPDPWASPRLSEAFYRPCPPVVAKADLDSRPPRSSRLAIRSGSSKNAFRIQKGEALASKRHSRSAKTNVKPNFDAGKQIHMNETESTAPIDDDYKPASADTPEDIPDKLKFAAAKRLGLTENVDNGRVWVPSAMHSRANSRERNSTNPSTSPSSKQGGYVRLVPSSLRAAPANESFDSQDSFATDKSATTFYLSSSDSETDDDDDQQSSRYSNTSSHTSYNFATSSYGDIDSSPKPRQQNLDDHARSNFSPSKPSPSHQSQSPRSSHHNRPLNTSQPLSRPTSFSRPFNRAPPTSSNTQSQVYESEPPSQLAAIREDSPVPAAEAAPPETPKTVPMPKKTTAIQRKRVPPALNLVRRSRGGTSARLDYSEDCNTPNTPKAKSETNSAPNTAQTGKEDDKAAGDQMPKANLIDRGSRAMRQALESRKSAKLPLNILSSRDAYAAQEPQRLATPDRKSARPLSLAITRQSEVFVSSDSAEVIILQIFEQLESFHDLFACAKLNQGFYKVFKKHELHLMKNALRNMSPAQWELREASPAEIIARRRLSGYTPRTYVQFHKRDTYVLNSVKSLMFARCRAHLRSETIKALVETDSMRSQHIDDALWRIWTFCTMFGADNVYEHDREAQVDWLCGGIKAQTFKNLEDSVSSKGQYTTLFLKHAPDSFGLGNYGGLTADELSDILEAWNCIVHLMSGILGRCDSARKYGIFENKLGNGHATEESLLQEWVYYLTSLGLSTVVDLAHQTDSKTDELFQTAKQMEWTNWTAPDEGKTRAGFLKDVVTSLLQQKTQPVQEKSLEEVQAQRKSRGLELAAGLREQKTRSMLSLNPLSQHSDESIYLWLEWMARAESEKPYRHSRVEPLPEPAETPDVMDFPIPPKNASRGDQTLQAMESDQELEQMAHAAEERDLEATTTDNDPAFPRAEVPNNEMPLKSVTDQTRSRSNSCLSLFPPQYTKPASARATPQTTPRASIAMPSQLKSTNQPETSILKAVSPEQFAPRLSVCPEA